MKLVDLNIIKQNVKGINKIIYAVVKNDAYGLGLEEVASLLINNGVSRFCVNTLQEGIRLRRINDNIYILLLSDFEIDLLDLYKKYNITVTLSDLNKREYLNDLDYEVKLNLGLNRYGLDICDYVKLDKIYYAHLPDFDNPTKYMELVNKYNVTHFSSSNKIKYSNEYVRVGMALYRDCLEIVEEIKNIKYVKKGEYIGYNYINEFDCYIGIINIGYYNGLTALNRGRLVFINGGYYEIVAISMNHTFIRINKEIKINDTVEIMGKNITVNYIANYLNVSEYEAFTMIKDNIKYIELIK